MQTDVRRTCVMNVIYKDCALHTSSTLFGEICIYVHGIILIMTLLVVPKTQKAEVTMYIDEKAMIRNDD